MLLVTSPELLNHLAVSVLRHCQELRRDGRPVPPEFGQLRDELHRAARSGQQRTAVEIPTALPEPVAVDYAEAARRLSVSTRTVRRLTADGRLPVVRMGRRVVIPVEALTEFARQAAA